MQEMPFPPASHGGTIYQNGLQQLLSSHRVIYRARTVFPFELFPSEIIITEGEVHLIKNIFLNSAENTSLALRDIATCSCSTSMVFGSIRIELTGEVNPKHTIQHLWRDEAIQATRIINGLRRCVHSGIDLSQYQTEDIRNHVARLGNY